MYSFFFFLMIRPPPKSTLFPYTPLFRSVLDPPQGLGLVLADEERAVAAAGEDDPAQQVHLGLVDHSGADVAGAADRKSTRLNSSHANISYAVFCLKKKKTIHTSNKCNHN